MDTSQTIYFLVILQAAIVLTKFFNYPIIIPQPVVITNVILYLFLIIDCSYFNGLCGKHIPISKNLNDYRMA